MDRGRLLAPPAGAFRPARRIFQRHPFGEAIGPIRRDQNHHSHHHHHDGQTQPHQPQRLRLRLGLEFQEFRLPRKAVGKSAQAFARQHAMAGNDQGQAIRWRRPGPRRGSLSGCPPRQPVRRRSGPSQGMASMRSQTLYMKGPPSGASWSFWSSSMAWARAAASSSAGTLFGRWTARSRPFASFNFQRERSGFQRAAFRVHAVAVCLRERGRRQAISRKLRRA